MDTAGEGSSGSAGLCSPSNKNTKKQNRMLLRNVQSYKKARHRFSACSGAPRTDAFRLLHLEGNHNDVPGITIYVIRVTWGLGHQPEATILPNLLLVLRCFLALLVP